MLPHKNEVHGIIANDAAISPDSLVIAPKHPYVAAIGQLEKKVAGLEVDFDHFGAVRHISTSGDGNLLLKPSKGTPRAIANAALRQKQVSNALGLRYVEITKGAVTKVPTGWRVEYRQIVHVKGHRRALLVRGGFVHVQVDDNGRVFQVTSTIRRGCKPSSLNGIISPKEAIAAAKEVHGEQTCERARCTLTISAHNGSLDPVYEVLLSSCAPEKKVVQYMVKAHSASVVYQESKLHYSGPAKVRCFLRIPDPNASIDQQVLDHVIASLPDPTVLKNERFVPKVMKNGSWVDVQAKDDGTFNFKPGDPEFSAVVFFVAVNSQFELLEGWGMVKQDRPITCFMDDPSVQDNAYFDGEGYEIHMGVGSGSNAGGLSKWIAFDLGVEWHENGHHMVFLQTPGKDLPGSEGAGAHEASGDWQDLLMDFWFRLQFGDQLGHKLTKEDVANDTRVIGKYALPPDGIRIQKNSKRTPQDKTGEPHDDGLIIGGALADLLVSMATQPDVELKDALANNGRLYLAALALVPAHKVLWVDILRALKTADQKLFKGANWTLIEKAFKAHGIVLSSRVDPDAKPKPPRKPGKPRKPRKGPKGPGKQPRKPRRKAA
jgi:hypothetical protein